MAAVGGRAPPPGSPPPAESSPPGVPPGSPSRMAVGPEANDQVRKDILARIGVRVTELLGQAKKDSESKVKAELKALNDIMRDMDKRIDMILEKLDDVEKSPPEGAVEPSAVAQSLAKLEQQWGKELGKLKQELHQTIYAHNHNADLLKHQKDALDGIRTDIELMQKSPDADRIKAAKIQLQKADSLIKSQQKQKKLEPLFRRLVSVEQRIASSRWPMGLMPPMAHAGMGMPGLGLGMPGMAGLGMPGMGPMPTQAQLAAAAARMPNPAAAAAAAAAWGGPRGLLGGQADALAARQAAQMAAMAAAGHERGFAGMGLPEKAETSEEEEEVDTSRPPGLL